MSYCRFRNTLSALRDCYENINEPTNQEELRAREQLLALAQRIIDAADTSLKAEDEEE